MLWREIWFSVTQQFRACISDFFCWKSVHVPSSCSREESNERHTYLRHTRQAHITVLGTTLHKKKRLSQKTRHGHRACQNRRHFIQLPSKRRLSEVRKTSCGKHETTQRTEDSGQRKADLGQRTRARQQTLQPWLTTSSTESPFQAPHITL